MARALQPADVELAVQLYYERIELTNKDIHKLFNVKSSTTVARLKSVAIKAMAEKGQTPFSTYSVNTETAYEAWNLDITDLERRLTKLRKLKFRS